MNAIELLVEQHRTLESSLNDTLETQDPTRRAALFARAADLLTVHIASEEEVFYPAVKDRLTEDVLLESLEEHLSLKRLLADLLELDPQEQTYEPKLKVLTEQSEHHHKEEEEHLFPTVRDMLDDERLQALGQDMAALQQRLRRAGEPREAVSGQTDEAAPLK